TGEILYLMLCRSRHVDQLREVLVERLFGVRAPYDGLVQALQGETQLARNPGAGAYLPCRSHPVYDGLESDWLSLLSLYIPVYNGIPGLVQMTLLHLVL